MHLRLHPIPAITLASALVAAVLAIAQPAQAQDAPPVDVAKPLVKTVTDYDVYTGRFEAVDRVELRARVSGYLERVGFQDGDLVEKDELLFRIDPRPFQAVVARAQAALAAARATRDLAMLELDRATTLAERNVGTVQEVDRTRATVAEAEAQVAVAEAELRSAQLDLDFTEIRAPFDALISDRKVDPGNLVVGGATQATLLAVVVTTDPIYFTFTASEADYLRYMRLVGEGSVLLPRNKTMDVSVRLMDEREFHHAGQMEFLSNELDPNSGTITGRALIENGQGLILPGVFGRIRLPGSGPYEALLIPDQAVLSDQARKVVMVVDAEGTVSQRAIEIGPVHFGLRVVRSGLDPDDRVVVAGVQRARPGVRVTPNEVTVEAMED